LFEALLTTAQQTLPLTLFERFRYLLTTTWVYHVVAIRILKFLKVFIYFYALCALAYMWW